MSSSERRSRQYVETNLSQHGPAGAPCTPQYRNPGTLLHSHCSVTVQSLLSRCSVAVQLLLSHCTVTAPVYSRCTVTAQLLYSRCSTVQGEPRKKFEGSRCTATAQSLLSRCTVAAQSLHSRCPVTAQSPWSHCSVAAQSLSSQSLKRDQGCIDRSHPCGTKAATSAAEPPSSSLTSLRRPNLESRSLARRTWHSDYSHTHNHPDYALTVQLSHCTVQSMYSHRTTVRTHVCAHVHT